VLEYDLDYTDTNCISANVANTTCADVLQRNNYTGVSCLCTKNFTLDKAFNVSELILKNKRIFLW